MIALDPLERAGLWLTVLFCFGVGGLVLLAFRRLVKSSWWIDDEPESTETPPSRLKFEVWEPTICPKCQHAAELCRCSLNGEDETDEWMRKP